MRRVFSLQKHREKRVSAHVVDAPKNPDPEGPLDRGGFAHESDAQSFALGIDRERAALDWTKKGRPRTHDDFAAGAVATAAPQTRRRRTVAQNWMSQFNRRQGVAVSGPGTLFSTSILTYVSPSPGV